MEALKSYLKDLEIDENDCEELLNYGKNTLDYALSIFEKYKLQGKYIPKPFPFLRKVCQNYLQSKKESANIFNSKSIQQNEDEGKSDHYKTRPINMFIWKENLKTPYEIEQEDYRFEEWLKSDDGAEYLRRYGIKDIPSHFKPFAREVMRFNRQMRQFIVDQADREKGISLIGALECVRPITPRHLIKDVFDEDSTL